MHWKPAHATHAIDRMALSFRTQPLPPKPFVRMANRIKSLAAERGISEQVEVQQPSFGFEISVDGVPRPMAVPNAQPRSFIYRKIEGEAVIMEVACTPDSIAMSCNRYISWNDFISEARHVLTAPIDGILDVVDMQEIRLEYWNRFVPSPKDGGVQLLNPKSEFVGRFAASHPTSLHTHVGLFVEADDGNRRLVNANVDLNIVSDLEPRPIGQDDNALVYSLVSSLAIDASTAASYLGPLCESSHNLLKNVLNDILSVEMVEVIALDAPVSAA